MVIQIYGITTSEDATMVAGLGADHIGVSYGDQHLTANEVDFATARAIFAAVSHSVVRVGLTVSADLDQIERTVGILRPDILHLSGDLEPFPPAKVEALRSRLPDLPIMQAIPVTGPESVNTALEYAELADYLLLDTDSSEVVGIGATGQTHDWSISRKIVEETQVPVILAGGLSPENVVEAIRTVRPWGVDSLTHTNWPDRPHGKDHENARAAAQRWNL
jgi:phosphoribosylanthranilate isomerase